MKAIVTVGISASGKSTWAKQQVGYMNINRDDIRFNTVCPGGNWNTYKFNKKNEQRVEELFWDNVADNYNVIGVVDDRPQMIRLWHELKIMNVICVGNPYIEF